MCTRLRDWWVRCDKAIAWLTYRAKLWTRIRRVSFIEIGNREDDLYGIMRVVFINNSGDHNSRVNEQVKMMNTMVIKTAVGQIQSGVSQYMGYVHDMDRGLEPIDAPVNTSTTGNKIGLNNKIGV